MAAVDYRQLILLKVSTRLFIVELGAALQQPYQRQRIGFLFATLTDITNRYLKVA